MGREEGEEGEVEGEERGRKEEGERRRRKGEGRPGPVRLAAGRASTPRAAELPPQPGVQRAPALGTLPLSPLSCQFFF